MYAVIQTGGKQYRVEPGKTVVVEKLAGDAGAPVVFDHVLLVSSGDGGSVTVGRPTVAGAKVTGEIVEQGRGEKLVVFKFRRRKNYVRRNGHRQSYTAVKIAAIDPTGEDPRPAGEAVGVPTPHDSDSPTEA